MKSLGLIGGTSWHSTLDYARQILSGVNERKGPKVNPPLLVYTLNQEAINRYQEAGEWPQIAATYTEVGRKLIAAGAEGLILCANTAHRIYDDLDLGVPILHIADATGRAAREQNLKTLGLLGTRFTMEGDFISGRLKEKFELETMVPEAASRESLHRMIHEQLCRGDFNDGARALLREQIEALKKRGAEGIILGCTELPMLLPDEPAFDTLKLHAAMAVDFILG